MVRRSAVLAHRRTPLPGPYILKSLRPLYKSLHEFKEFLDSQTIKEFLDFGQTAFRPLHEARYYNERHATQLAFKEYLIDDCRRINNLRCLHLEVAAQWRQS